MYRNHQLALAICAAALSGSGATAIAACAFDAAADGAVQLLPAGKFRATDGRPTECGAWLIDAAIAAQVIARAAERANKIVIDYEHQTILSEENGQPAPAAGWCKRLEWREGQGLFATDAEWTERAKAMLQAGEYKYISPVFEFDKATGAVVRILSVALTNYPGIDGMSEVLVRAAARMSHSNQESTQMSALLKALLSSLGLPETVTEADATAAVTALKTKAAKVDEQDTTIAALKAATPDPAKFVPIETMTALQTELATLRAKTNQNDVDATVAAALAEGKLLPAQEAWAKSLGAKDFAALKAFVDSAQPIAALAGQQSQGKPPVKGADAHGLTDVQLAICKNIGIAPADYKKSLDEGAETA